MNVEEKLDDHEKRISNLEVSDARVNEKIANLATSTDRLLKVTILFGLILLGTVCYMALGRQGYKDVVGGPILTENHPILQNNTEQIAK